MTNIYRGWSWGKTLIGECKDGGIYEGWGMGKELVGVYDDYGNVYKGFALGKTLIGSYSDGNIYVGSVLGKTLIGTYKDGNIYEGCGTGKELVGVYEGPDEGAAAAAFLLLLEKHTVSEEKNNISPSQDFSIEPNNTTDTSIETDYTSGTSSQLTPGLVLFFTALGLIALIAVITWLAISDSKNKAVAAAAAKFEKYETIFIGQYEQDGDYTNGKEDIEWLVLDRKNDEILVISKYCLENKYYDEKNWGVSTTTDWETCTIRKWLNSSFYYDAFSNQERERILLSDVRAYDNTKRLNDTKDYLFLLAGREVEQYFKAEEDKYAIQTKAASQKGGGGNSTQYAEWWLRVSLSPSQYGPTVSNHGTVWDPGYQQAYSLKLSVRPAMWIKAGEYTSESSANVAGAVPETSSLSTIDSQTKAVVTALKDANIGSIIEFGQYEQDNIINNGKEKIKWIVLEKDRDHVLLFSQKILDAQPFNKNHPYSDNLNKKTSVTWKTCSLRKWLNSDFYQVAFTSSEQAVICERKVLAERNQWHKISGGEDTTDKIFLLSISEVECFFPNTSDRIAIKTVYAQNRVPSYSNMNWWWLRNPGMYIDTAAVVLSKGGYSESKGEWIGRGVNNEGGGIRPALWISLEE